MHGALIQPEQIDDFVIIRTRRITSSVRRALTRGDHLGEKLAVLEWQLLFSIARFGSCHVAFVTKHISIDPVHRSKATETLKKMGLISRCEHPDNKRRTMPRFMPRGIKRVERIWYMAKQVTANFTDRLSAEEFEELRWFCICSVDFRPHFPRPKSIKVKFSV